MIFQKSKQHWFRNRELRPKMVAGNGTIMLHKFVVTEVESGLKNSHKTAHGIPHAYE